MAIPDAQAEAAACLAALSEGPPIETAISAVFLGDGEAWKLRKAVRLPFLDFSTLARRNRAAHRDFELNHDGAPDIYKDVMPITRGPEGVRLGGSGEVIDWVVRMARVPADDFLDAVAARGGVTSALLDAIADLVASCHTRLVPGPIDHPATMRFILDGNVESARTAGLGDAVVMPVIAALRRELDRLTPWLQDRNAQGFVRRAHGDLHLGNLCLWHGDPVPFDALEFDERLGTIDLGYDLAFLLMDLEMKIGRPAANRVLNRYLARTGDIGMLAGLPFFLSLRALIRAHVTARMGGDATSHLRFATDAIAATSPVLLALGGLPGSGKSTLARRIAPLLGRPPGAVILRADEARKRRFGVAPETRLPAAAYDETVSRAVLAGLMADAAVAIAAGHSVILDTTFLDPLDRAAARAAAGSAAFHRIWLDAPLAVLEARIAARAGDASDADVAVLRRAAMRPKPADWPVLDTTDPRRLDRIVTDLTQPPPSC